MSPAMPDGPRNGLSERLKQLDHAQDHVALPEFDLDAAVRGGRRRHRRRTAATALATAATVAVLATAVTLGPLHNGGGQAVVPAHPVVTSTPATIVPPDHLDSGHITAVQTTSAGTTISYQRVLCDDKLDAHDSKGSGQAICEVASAAGQGQAEDQPGPDLHSKQQTRLAPGAVIIGSVQLALYLHKPDPATLDWFQLPAKDRHVSITSLRRFVATANGKQTIFRLHYDQQNQVDVITEVYQQ